MKASNIIRIALWVIWPIYTAIMVHYWKVSEVVKKVIQNIVNWITENPVGVASIIWGLFTVALCVDIALKQDRQSWTTEQLNKIKYIRENEK